MKKISIIILWIAASVLAQGQSAYIPPEKPKLVIGIIVEQLRYDQLEKLRDILPENGIRKMINEGTYYKNASYDYLLTQAAPGYATISTGTDPSFHGMTSDSWYHPFSDQVIYCVQDSKANPVGGSFETGLFSPANLLSSTFADELEMATCGEAKVFGIGFREMGAILTAGHSADGAYWYDDRTGTWMSSTYYTQALPGWLMDFNAMMFSEKYINSVWTPLMEPSLYPGCQIDSSKSERGFNGQTWFPYNLKEMSTTGKLINERRNYGLLRETPFADDFTTDLALRLIENEGLGQDDVVDYLAITYSAEDYIGHRFGPSSVEAADAIVRLDRNISRLIEVINSKLGKKNVLVYFVAAHGVSEIPSVLEANRIPSGYFRAESSAATGKSDLMPFMVRETWVRGSMTTTSFLTEHLLRRIYITRTDGEKNLQVYGSLFGHFNCCSVPCL